MARELVEKLSKGFLRKGFVTDLRQRIYPFDAHSIEPVSNIFQRFRGRIGAAAASASRSLAEGESWESLANHLCVKLRCIPIINPADNDDMFIFFICMLGEELFVAEASLTG